ncbi:MAG: hypothetical protein GX483_04855 [Actinomycetaceae bacterium]|nr:hypothetical protein [Actinomycetaceae bacterium]
MITYATVGITRIQSYLGRSRDLWGRRGASENLMRATDLTENSDYLVHQALSESNVKNSNVKINDDGLDIDGVVSLQGNDHDETLRVARKLANLIREENPGVFLTVSWTQPQPEDVKYAQLLSEKAEWKQQWHHEYYFPVASEFPFLRPCDECGVDPAASYDEVRGLRLCADCNRRVPDDSRTQSMKSTGLPKKFAVEWEFLNRVLHEEKLGYLTPKHFRARDFESLGKLGRPAVDDPHRGRTADGNHIALIFADGNGVGGLFKKLQAEAEDLGSTQKMRKVSEKMKESTFNALVSATQRVVTPKESCPVVPHIVGGDDILISVAANKAWEFLLTFMQDIRAPFEELSGEHGVDLSFSAGMVICQSSFPFGNQVEIAETLMKQAKKAVRGKDWSFAWLDMTVDGYETKSHGVWLLKDTAGADPNTEFVEALRIARTELTAHGESQLRLVLGQSDNLGANLDHLAKRQKPIVNLLKACGVPHPQSIDSTQAKQILDVLGIGRWWRLSSETSAMVSIEPVDSFVTVDTQGVTQ